MDERVTRLREAVREAAFTIEDRWDPDKRKELRVLRAIVETLGIDEEMVNALNVAGGAVGMVGLHDTNALVNDARDAMGDLLAAAHGGTDGE